MFGLAAELLHDEDLFQSTNSEASLLALPYDGSTLVDRFDGRLLLDSLDPAGVSRCAAAAYACQVQHQVRCLDHNASCLQAQHSLCRGARGGSAE